MATFDGPARGVRGAFAIAEAYSGSGRCVQGFIGAKWWAEVRLHSPPGDAIGLRSTDIRRAIRP